MESLSVKIGSLFLFALHERIALGRVSPERTAINTDCR